jgi:hypothetical protein
MHDLPSGSSGRGVVRGEKDLDDGVGKLLQDLGEIIDIMGAALVDDACDLGLLAQF